MYYLRTFHPDWRGDETTFVLTAGNEDIQYTLKKISFLMLAKEGQKVFHWMASLLQSSWKKMLLSNWSVFKIHVYVAWERWIYCHEKIKNKLNSSLMLMSLICHLSQGNKTCCGVWKSLSAVMSMKHDTSIRIIAIIRSFVRGKHCFVNELIITWVPFYSARRR